MALIKCCECGKEISDKATTCIHCGCTIEKKYICPECGEHHDRDINAAKNIKNFGLHPQALIGIEQKIENY